MSSPLTSSNPALIVPMDVAALLIGNGDHKDDQAATPSEAARFARVAADFNLLPNAKSASKAYLSESVLPQPFETQSQPMPPGIHLHFALPDSIARGETGDDGNVTFRPAPNRFLVVRIATRQITLSSSTRIAAWVVEGDHSWNWDDSQRTADPRNSLSRPVPSMPNPHDVTAPSHTFRGRVVRLENWVETAPTGSGGHTAIGYGAPDYAAAYSHAPNVFGFFDPATSTTGDDLNTGLGTDYPAETSRLAYLVIGWYSDPGNDPITAVAQAAAAQASAAGLALPDAFAAALKDHYHWSYDTSSGAMPDRTLCVGVVTDIQWDPNGSYLEARSISSPLDVAIGSTTAEALSALLAKKRPDLQNLEAILNALQFGQLRQLEADAVDGLANLQDNLHGRGFTSFAAADDAQPRPAAAPEDLKTAGVLYTVKRNSASDSGSAQTDTDGDNSALQDTAATAGKPLPPDIAAALNDLNEAQSTADNLSIELRVRRSQVFCDWYKYIVVNYSGQGAPALNVNSLVHYLKAEIGAVNTCIAALTAACMDRNDKYTSMVNLLNGSYAGQYLLASTPAPRYYQPADPVLLLAGPDVTPSFRYGGDGRFSPDGTLGCRLSSDAGHTGNLVSAMTIAAQRYGSLITVVADQFPKLPASAGLTTQQTATFNSLLADALFLDPNAAWELAAIAHIGDNSLVSDIQAAQTALAATPLSPVEATGTLSFTGVAPSPEGLQRHAQPWVPLLLQWEAAFQPFLRLTAETAGDTYPTDWVTTNFRLDASDIEAVYQKDLPATLDSNAERYSGTVVLAHNTDISLKDQIDQYLTNYPDDPDQPVLSQLRDNLDFAMMAQALSGFHRALIMRKQTLQMPVFVPQTIDPANTNGTVAAAVADANDAVALPLNDYNPVRAGLLTITRLRIVDAFGQIRDVTPPGSPVPLIPSNAMSLPGAEDGRALLPLRITQPARLSFRYIAATPGPEGKDLVEMNSDVGSSPVFGWILFNRLDSSLMIYDADGTPRGSFNQFGAFWQGAPGSESTFEQPFDAAFESASPHLRAFAASLNAGGQQFLNGFFKTLDDSADRIAPETHTQDGALALLVSRSFALVRATVSLDLYGNVPAVSQSYPAMQATLDAFNGALTPDARSADGRYTADFEKVRFPVHIGDITRINDGVVGYYVESDTADPYKGPLWSAAAAENAPGIQRPPHEGAITLSPADETPAVVTMIVDPRAPVHAITGILPVKQISLPPAHYAPAMKRIAVTFLTAPVLGHSEQMAIPLPGEPGYDWSWLTPVATTEGRSWSEQKPVMPPNPRAAFADLPQQVVEGWLRLSPSEEKADAQSA